MEFIKIESTENKIDCIKSEPIEDTMECIKSETFEDNSDHIQPVSTVGECVVANSLFFKEIKKEKEKCNAHNAGPPLKKKKNEHDSQDGTESTNQDKNTVAPVIEFIGVKGEFSSKESFSSEFSSSDDDDNEDDLQWEEFFVEDSLNKNQQSPSPKHKRPGSPTLKYSCLKCPFRTNTHHKLLAHNKIQKHYKCPYDCPYVAASPLFLKQHNMVVHKKSESHKCSLCDSTFITKAAVKRHAVSAHFGTHPYKCELCEHTFPMLVSLKTHIKKCHERKYLCPNCEFRTDEQATLDVHQRNAHQRNAHQRKAHLKTFRCTYCDKKYSNKSSLVDHVRRWHVERQPLPCPECSFSTESKLEYEEHWKSVHLNARVFKCRACEFKSGYKEVWQNHIDTVHARPSTSRPTNKLSKDNLEEPDTPKENPLRCAHCKFVGIRPSDLAKHVKHIHSDQKQFHQCTRCDFSTYRDSFMVEHAAEMHPGQKPFQCLDCGSGFKSSSTLRQHIKGIHLKLRRLLCAFCQYGTYEKSFMENHIEKTGHKQIPHQ